MQIPTSCVKCQSWINVLKADNDGHENIAKNIENERCIPEEVCTEFFEDLESYLTAKGIPANVEDATNGAMSVIISKRGRFLCCGKQIDDNLFATLCRIDHVEALMYMKPVSRRRMGIQDEDSISGLPEEEIMSLVDDYDEPIELGNTLGICFTTDNNSIDLSDIKKAIDFLGLKKFDLDQDQYYVICVYKREKIGRTLHLPRVFDAINQKAFVLDENCNAVYGMTRPLTLPPEQGVPEAVHRSCSVEPEEFRLGRIA